MADSDDYGTDDFDDTEVFMAATQAEQQQRQQNTTLPFQSSPRPSKRRKISPGNERTSLPIPPNKQPKARRAPFVSSDWEHDSNPSGDFDSDNAPRKGATPAAASRMKNTRASSNDYQHAADHDTEEEAPGNRPSTTARKTKKDRIYQPTTIREMNDIFCTQPPREDSPPWKTRGAIWAKPKTATNTTTTGIHRPAEPPKSNGLGAKNTISLQGKQFIPAPPAAQASKPPETPVSRPNGAAPPTLPIANGTTTEYDPTDELADLPSDAFESSPTSPHDDIVVVSATRKHLVAPQTGLRQTTLFGREGPNGQIPPSQVNKRYNFIVDQKAEPPTHHKLDYDAIKTWIYPTNLGTIRDYQFNIVAKGLFHNLLVALPTGLGKTFIAATVMLNWFRWTKEAQIVFVAPTKPLVSQQIEACFQIAGIPRSSTTMLTGGVSPALRSEEWANKRVFFMTPQTLLNDLKSGYADPKKIVLVVVDEAHRATGAYAYVEVVSLMRRFNPSFRILALTATPGADVEAVQKVIDGLDISRVEIRTESSLDIREYVHSRKVDKHVFQNSEEMEMCMELYSKTLQPLVNTVAGLNAYYSKDPLDLTPYGCQTARNRWLQEAGRSANQGVKGTVMAVFAILGSVSQAMELLKFHGIVPFYIKLKDFRDAQAQSKSKYRKQVVENDNFKKLMVRLQTWVADANFVGHPKLEYLQGVVLDHFTNALDGLNPNGAPPAQTRIMIFAHFRDSAEDIVRVLKKHEPMIRPHVFVGQSTAKNSEGMDQKEQLRVIEQFKMGTFNTLVATSIGEEGLDIGEVDLIICYDSKASPIRMLQRMGRTGRKRQGRIVMLQMKGKEENDAMKAKDNYERMQELIAEGSSFAFHEDISRRILPADVKPVVDRRVVEIPLENSQQDWLPEPKKRGRMKKPPKKFHMPDNVITGFVTAGCMNEEIQPKARGQKKVKVYPSEEMADLPSLESVLLNEKATKDLQRRYQTVFDEEDAPIVGELDLSGHSQRALSQTKHILQHGHVTRTFVDTLRRMHAMDGDRLNDFERNLHHSDCESDPDNNIIVSDVESRPIIQDDMWADDDPASQTFQVPRARTKPSPKTSHKTKPKAKAPRGPRKDTPTAATTTPVRQSNSKSNVSKAAALNWRASDDVDEGASSSPPPTDPRFRIASQAETIGSDDTIGEDEIQDTQAYMFDSDLVSFIAGDDEEIHVPDSSLPGLNFDLGDVGKGTQAVITGARPKRPKKAEKLFTSDPTDDDAVVSSDSDDDDEPPVRTGAGANKRQAFVMDTDSDDEPPVNLGAGASGGRALISDSEDEDEEQPVLPRKRVRMVIDEDESDE